MDWPVGNRFHWTDLESMENFLKKINSERNKRAIGFEFEVTQLFENCLSLANSPTGNLIVASKETASSYIDFLSKSLCASSYIDFLSNSLCYNQWTHDFFYSFTDVHSSNNLTHLYTTLVERGNIRDRDQLELLRAIEWSLFWEIKESGLSIIIFARDYACSPSWAEELVKIVGFIKKMKPDTIFPVSFVSYNVEQSKIDERTESYTIVFDKDEEDFSDKDEEDFSENKKQRWINILTEVTIPSSESSERVNDMDWPVGNRFHGTDLQCVQNFRKKIDG
ncbi:hypothetical protein DKX38_019902 [Salix brachista]|uniref:ADP-ribosyl cyclase/cyclic ADP-ribose hydrolase n=1 Tax=Salix brachista TaxID=2182728 RepID=A0A5N5KHM7_9ROSI|nr:hypothetical protein DKX38_019902 [Salix brachista]